MSNGKIDLVDIAAGIIVVLLGYAIYDEYSKEKDKKKKKKILEDSFKKFNFDEILDLDKELHRGFKNAVDELRKMLLGSLIKMDEKPFFDYPIAAGMLMRSSYEQSIKVFIESNGGKIARSLKANEKEMLNLLQSKNDEQSKILKGKLETFIKDGIKNTFNEIVHSPENIEKVKTTMIEHSVEASLLLFISDTIALSVQQKKHS